MKLKVSIFLLGLLSLSLLASCDKSQRNTSNESGSINKFDIPDDTTVSYNLVKNKNNNFELYVYNKLGEKVNLTTVTDTKSKYSRNSKLLLGQQDNEIRIFLENGSCKFFSCFPGGICKSAVVDSDAKCAVLKSLGLDLE